MKLAMSSHCVAGAVVSMGYLLELPYWPSMPGQRTWNVLGFTYVPPKVLYAATLLLNT